MTLTAATIFESCDYVLCTIHNDIVIAANVASKRLFDNNQPRNVEFVPLMTGQALGKVLVMREERNVGRETRTCGFVPTRMP